VTALIDKGRSSKHSFVVAGILLLSIVWLNTIGSVAMAMTLTSSAFEQGGQIPSKYTCEGNDISPPLAWDEAPEGTKSFALIVDDPDAPDPKAPRLVWVHWVVYNIPPDTTNLPEDAESAGLAPDIALGINDFKKTRYGGPCPPIGRHRYFHKLYALDTTLDLNKPSKSEIERAMKGHVLATAELIGTYKKGDQ
jgi:Raf kinase inhibitor-like YbhB/YbcL family protein